MSEYRFFHPLEVRYGDLDPQGHLNNARYLTFMEQARIQYVKQLGLWHGGSFIDIGVIIAEARITFKAPIQFGQLVEVGVRTSRLGKKSFDMLYTFLDRSTEQEMAHGMTVQVSYDYRRKETIPIPKNWRITLQTFEALSVTDPSPD